MLIKTKQFCLWAVLFAGVLFGCGGVEIEQKVAIYRYTDCKYVVGTYIWIRDWKGSAKTLEYREDVFCEVSQIDSVKAVELEKAEKAFQKIVKCYEQGCP